MLSFLIGILAIGALLYLAIIYMSTSLALLGFSLAVLFVFSFFYLLSGRRNVSARMEAPISIADKNQPFSIQVHVKNRKRIGYGKAKFRIEYGNTMENKKKKIWVKANHITGGDSEFQYELEIQKAGNYEFVCKKVRIYDLFGLFFFTKKERGGINVLVLPDVEEIPVSLGESVHNFFGDADVFDELRPGYDSSETFEVREYRAGDKLPSIHWKLSAKMDELMVKESSLPRACPVILLLNSGGVEHEKMLQLIASVSFSLMDAKCPHYAVWMSRSRNDVLRARVDCEESFYQFLVFYMQDREKHQVPGLKERYYEKYRGEHCLHELVFEKGRMYLDELEIEDTKQFELLLK